MTFASQLRDHLQVLESTRVLFPDLERVVDAVQKCLSEGHRVFWAGNGGSAADAQHLAAELIGRFQHTRRALASLALSTDTSVLTAVGNDFGFEQIFSRQLEGLANAGDIFFGISTSGASPNIVTAISVAKKLGIQCVVLCGRPGSVAANAADIALAVNSESTARIQEAHIFLGHLICDQVEQRMMSHQGHHFGE